MNTIKKRIRLCVLLCLFVTAVFMLWLGVSACSNTAGKTQVTLVNWEDEVIEVELNSDVSVSTDAAYDADGNAYAVTAKVEQSDGAPAEVLGGVFRAEYAGGYRIVYSLADTSPEAASRTVTVNIKDSDTPAPFFTKTLFFAYEDEDMPVPAYEVLLKDGIAISGQTLTLYKTDGETRTEADFDAGAQTLRLEAGNYVFVLQVSAENGKSGSAELSFRVRSASERSALASLNDANSNAIGVSYWDNSLNGWATGSSAFTSEMYRNEYVSEGSVKAVLPGSAGSVSVFVSPEMSKADFASKMQQSGAVISVWLYIDAEDGSSRSVTYGSKTVEAANGTWTNALISASDLGAADPGELYRDLNTDTALFAVENPSGKAFTLYVDSVYVATPFTASLAAVSGTYGSEITLAAQSGQTSEFYYELYDVASSEGKPQINDSGTFTPRVAGKMRAVAYPVSNAFISQSIEGTVTVSVDGGQTFAFGQDSYELPYGGNERPSISGFDAVKYAVASADGSACYSYIDGGTLRLFEGEYFLYAYAEKDGVSYTTYALVKGGAASIENGELENFDSPASVRNVTNPSLFSYVGDYEGAQGVAKFVPGPVNIWAGFTLLQPNFTLDELKAAEFDENDYVEFRMLVENLPGNYIFYYTPDYGTQSDYTVGWFLEGVWQSFYVPANVFFEDFEGMFTDGEGTFCFTNNAANNAEVYIDYIRFVKADRTAVEETATSVEYENFGEAVSVVNIAKNSNGIAAEWLDKFEEADGVMKLSTPFDEIWPTIRGFLPRLSKAEYESKGITGKDTFVIRVYSPVSNYTLGYNFASQNVDITLKQGWNEIEISASYVLDNFGNLTGGTAMIVFTKNNQAASHEIYIDSMYFVKSAVSYDLSEEGLLTIGKAGSDTFEVKVNDESVRATEQDDAYVYDIGNYHTQTGSESYDISFTITRRSGSRIVAEVEAVWFTPAAVNEINGIGSTAGKTALENADSSVKPTFESEVSDGTVTKYNVAKYDFSGYAWPTIKFGAPLCDAPADGMFDSVVFTIYIDAEDTDILDLDYKKEGNVLVKNFRVAAGWAEYRLPISDFNYDAFASGEEFLVLYYRTGSDKDGADVNTTLYLDGVHFEYEMDYAIDDGYLTIEKVDGLQYTVTLDGDPVAESGGRYDLVANRGSESYDVNLKIVCTGSDGTVLAQTETVYSTPGLENEINTVSSTAGRNAAINANDNAVTPAYEEQVSDGIVTKQSVLKYDLSQNEGPWPHIAFGAAGTAHATGGYSHIVFTMCITGDLTNVKLLYHGKAEAGGSAKELYSFGTLSYKGWYDYYLPIEYFDYDLFASGEQYLMPYISESAAPKLVVYVEGIRFAISHEMSEDGKLTVTDATAGATFKVTADGTEVSGTNNVYDIAAAVQKEKDEASDVAVEISRIVGGVAVAKTTLVWTSPAGEGEINGFASTAGRYAAAGGASSVKPTFESAVSDGTVTKNNVAKYDFSGYAWPTIKFGAPLCDAPADGMFDSVVFTIYIDAEDTDILDLDYKKEGNVLVKNFRVAAGWAEYRLPISDFNYDAFASGEEFLVLYYRTGSDKDGANVNTSVYIDGIRFEKEAA